jgi:POT family proton-dependent oligopeptide transporter
MNQAKAKKHPTGLYYLFFTEMWERFGYYLMLGIFSLYMLDSIDNGGMGFSGQKKSDIYGTYIGLVYLTPFLGGLLADRILGYRRSIFMGGLLMAAGYIGLALPGEMAFYVSLLLIIFGNGFFKPNISTLLGNLYNKDEYRSNKDSGYNIFYMGINIGAFVCNFVAAYLRINYGWGWAFAAAGVGMLLGLVIFMMGTKHVKEADVVKPLQEGDMSTGKILLFTLVPMVIFGIIGYFLFGVTGKDNPDGNIFGTDTNDAFLIGCIPVVTFFIFMFVRANNEDKRPIGALLSVYACIVVFWAVFHQNGDALTVWAENHTDRQMPETVATVAGKVDMAQTVTNHEIFESKEKTAHYLDSLRHLKETVTDKKQQSEIGRTIGSIETSQHYMSNLPKDQTPPPGKNLKLFSAELYQSINPFWVVVLTPIVVGFFGWMRKKNREPSTATKIFLGLVITALSAFVMVAAVKSTNMETDKASSWWLIASYGVITIGELCLSPMGLSLVSKLSPPRITALMMGGFFLSTSVGNKLSGILSGMWEGFEDKSNFFLMNFALVMAAAILMLLMLRWLNQVLREKNVR